MSALLLALAIATSPLSAEPAKHEQHPRRWRTAHTLTWFGPCCYGNGIAGPQRRLSRNSRGVAHRKLPMGTWVELRYRGRSVKARVITRGPYPRLVGIPDWQIPLDSAPATQLALVGQHSTVHGVNWRVLWRPDR